MAGHFGQLLSQPQGGGVRQCKSSRTSTVGPADDSRRTTALTEAKVARCSASGPSRAKPPSPSRPEAHHVGQEPMWSDSPPKTALMARSRAGRTPFALFRHHADPRIEKLLVEAIRR